MTKAEREKLIRLRDRWLRHECAADGINQKDFEKAKTRRTEIEVKLGMRDQK